MINQYKNDLSALKQQSEFNHLFTSGEPIVLENNDNQESESAKRQIFSYNISPDVVQLQNLGNN